VLVRVLVLVVLVHVLLQPQQLRQLQHHSQPHQQMPTRGQYCSVIAEAITM
jgi:hypothetical protein